MVNQLLQRDSSFSYKASLELKGKPSATRLLSLHYNFFSRKNSVYSIYMNIYFEVLTVASIMTQIPNLIKLIIIYTCPNNNV